MIGFIMALMIPPLVCGYLKRRGHEFLTLIISFDFNEPAMWSLWCAWLYVCVYNLLLYGKEFFG